MGTSLQVEPFCGLMHKVSPLTPRLLLNRDKVGARSPDNSGDSRAWGGFRFDANDNYRDVAMLCDCDVGVRVLAELCGWTEDLERLVKEATGEAMPPLDLQV